VQLWERSLFYYLRRMAKSEADTWDLLQETWLKVFRSIKSIRDPRTFPSFLYTTARHAAVSRLRGRAFEQTESAGEETSAPDCAFIAFDDAELPLSQREALTLYFLEELSIDEIAAVVGVPVGTIKSRLHYGKQAIRKLLSDGDDHVEPILRIS